MDETPNLSLPFIMEAQAQKHVTHNEAIRALDAVVQLSVLDRDLASPPAMPTDGDRYIVSAGATAAWLGQDLNIAAFQDGAWAFYQPRAGWLAWVADEAQLYAWSNAVWVQVADSDLQNIPMVGINTTADSTNRLSVSAVATLFNHEGAGHQAKINKAAPGDTASVLFQTSFSGRVEFGTTGDDDWHVKVSADGAAWNEALIADKASGAVRFPAGVEHALSRKPLTGLIHTPGGVGENSIWRSDVPRSGTATRMAAILSLSADTIILSTNDAPQFFSDLNMNGVSYVRIWNTSKTPDQSAWVKASSASNLLHVTDANDISGWLATETIQLRDPSKAVAMFALDISPMMQSQLGAVFPQAGAMCKLAVQMTTAVKGQIGLSPTAASGSLQNIFSFPDGTLNGGMAIIPCSELSPVSNSNLLYILEADGGADTLKTALASVFGVFA